MALSTAASEGLARQSRQGRSRCWSSRSSSFTSTDVSTRSLRSSSTPSVQGASSHGLHPGLVTLCPGPSPPFLTDVFVSSLTLTSARQDVLYQGHHA